MKKEVFVGIDISKKHLDLSLWMNSHEELVLQFENTPSKIRMVILDLMAKRELEWGDCIFCMEHTGIYTNHILRYLSIQNCKVYVVSPIHLKRSIGLTRGKNDRVDASRIARFIMRFHEDLIPYNVNPDIKHLHALSTQRTQLVSMLAQLKTPGIDHNIFSDKSTLKQLKKVTAPVEKALKNSISLIEKEILQFIDNNQQLSQIYKRLCTVPGVGPILASQLIIVTNGFTRLTEARKLACFAGVAPFEHSSGSSIRGRTRVSHFANKRIKTLLHLAAIRVIRLKGEMAEYYLRKKEEGKHSMSILNAIRNKIIHRVCAVIKAERNYEKPLTLS